MARGIRAIVLNSDETYAGELRTKLLKYDGVKIVAEVDEPALFPSALGQFPAELAIVNLDSDPEALIALTSEVLVERPDMCFFGVSSDNDPELILAALRAGFREFLVWPIDEEKLGEAMLRLAKLTPSDSATGKLIAVMGPTGGSGATTLASNLACELAQMGRQSAAIVDLDFAFGHVATMLDIAPQFTIADLCQTLDSIDPSMVEKALVRHDCGAMVLARPLRFAEAEQISAANSANVLNILCEMFEYVVCDGPTRNDPSSHAILDLADITIIPINLIVPAVRNVARILTELSRHGYNLDRIMLVVNRQNSGSTMLDMDDVEQCLNRSVDFELPDEGKTVGNAINMGQPLLVTAPKSKIRLAIHEIAEKIHNPSGDGKDDAESSGFLAKVLKR